MTQQEIHKVATEYSERTVTTKHPLANQMRRDAYTAFRAGLLFKLKNKKKDA